MNKNTINLHVDKIFLDGVVQLNCGQLSTVIEKELHRLISSQGLHNSLPNHIRDKSPEYKIVNSVYRGMR